jgi:hypothetical protein
MMRLLLSEPWVIPWAQIDLKDALIRIKDNGSEVITIKIGEGNLTYSEKRNMEYTLDRGILDEVREGDEVPMDVSFDFVWEFISGGGSSSDVSVEDALKQINGAAGWVSTDADLCRPYCVDIEVVYAPSPVACSTELETILFSEFRWESLDHDIRAGTISCSGRCNSKVATATRSANTSSP